VFVSIRISTLSLAIMVFLVSFADFALSADDTPLVINEIMASNSSTIQDAQFQYDDWIEIYNFGSSAIDVGGMYLTDDLSEPTKWQLPTNNPYLTTIPAHSYLLIWADNDTTDPGLHANFKLDAGGEEIGLFDSSPLGVPRTATGTDGSSLIDSIIFAEQTTDISYGRYPDANDTWQFMASPTPGRANNSGYIDVVAEPEFSHKRGFYDSPFSVTITTETEGATIFYTLDGSEPYNSELDLPTGTVYSNPIPIGTTTCLRAVAFKPGWKPTSVVTHTYIFLDDIIHQPARPTGFPNYWLSTPADYEMDPEIVNDPRYSSLIKDAMLSIPTMSLVMKNDDLFDSDTGIYANPTENGIAWERPASVELLYTDGTEEFQVNCGIRIQGGYFRRNDMTRKHSFRLLFKGIYGPTKLQFPLFGADAVDSFETIVLRGGANDGYAWDAARLTEQYTRDEFCRRLQLATGNASARGNFVHLYINGLYWGLYNPCERPDDSFSASYYGGQSEDWDTIHEGGYPGGIEATNGNFMAWYQMLAKCSGAKGSYAAYLELQGKNPDGTPNPVYPNLLDVTNYVDYLVVNLWGGNWDWPWKNYWLGRDSSENSTGFKFYNWDCENTVGNNRDRSPLYKNALNNDFSDAGQPHQSLKNNAEYRMLFADRVHKFFFNGGVLTPESLITRYAKMASEIEMAMIAESARWGDQHYQMPLTQQEWYNERDWILNTYLPQRSGIVVQQFRNAGLYPNIDAPVFNINGSYQHGGQIWPADRLSITAPMGTIYYCLDGSDPRLPGSSVETITSIVLVDENAAKKVLVPTEDINNDWINFLRFNDSSWISGTGGVGYEAGSGYESLINIDVRGQMYNRNTSCYIRIPFTVDISLSEFNFMMLNMRYDDGFVAYINGTEVQRTLFIGTPAWNSQANGNHEAEGFESFDISAHLNTLRQGENILAIHGLNVSANSSDFIISAELVAGQISTPGDTGVSPDAVIYTGPVTLTKSTHVKSRILDGSTWSALNEATFAVGPVTENLRITEIMYNPSTDPNEEYIELTNIGTETINLNLVRFTNGINFTFPDIDLAPGQYIVVVRNLTAFTTQYGTEINTAGQYSGSLNNAGEKIKLEDAIGQTILDFSYSDNWRNITDGQGYSLTIIDASNPDPNSWGMKDSWRVSTYIGGSPGWDDTDIPDPGSVVINEVLAHSHAFAADWIELYNTTGKLINIGGWFLSDSDPNLTKYEIADRTLLAPYGYIVFYEDLHFGNVSNPGCHTPFALSEDGETVYLTSAHDGELTGYRQSEDFGASQTGVSFGRYYKSSTDNFNFVAMSENTPGLANAYPKVGPVVINEIMYNPASGNQNEEYVELYNISSEPVTLYDYDKLAPWKFTDGIDFTFPVEEPVTIPAGGYLLLVKDLSAFALKYSDVPPKGVLGPYDGQLSNSGEKAELGTPTEADGDGNRYYIRMDLVNYSDGSHPQDCPGGVDLWPVEADGGGLSLSRRVSEEYGNDVANWQAASPSPGR